MSASPVAFACGMALIAAGAVDHAAPDDHFHAAAQASAGLLREAEFSTDMEPGGEGAGLAFDTLAGLEIEESARPGHAAGPDAAKASDVPAAGRIFAADGCGRDRGRDFWAEMPCKGVAAAFILDQALRAVAAPASGCRMAAVT